MTFDFLLSFPLVYRAWQGLFEKNKFQPVLEDPQTASPQSVLDLGCGPGTNFKYFSNSDYTGIDINPRYIAFANRKFPGKFILGDAVDYRPAPGVTYDLVLVNSLLHHIDDSCCQRLLTNAATLISDGGVICILDVYATSSGLSGALLALDRGKHARTAEKWNHLLAESYLEKARTPYNLNLFGFPAYHMFFYKGVPRAKNADMT